MNAAATNHATDEAVQVAHKRQQLHNRLNHDIKELDKGKLSTGEFRKLWSLHFDSKEHMDVCTCYGLCPFKLLKQGGS